MIGLLLQATIPSAIVSMLVLLIAWRPWRRVNWRSDGHWGTVLGCGAGYVASFFSVALVSRDAETSRLVLEQWEQWHWIVVVIGAVTAAGLVGALIRRPAWVGVLAGFTGVLLVSLLMNQWNQQGLWAWRAGLAGSVLLLWMAMEPLARVRRGASLPLAFLMIFFTASIILLLSGNETWLRLCAGTCAALGSCVIVSIWCSRFSMAGGAMVVLATMLVGHVELGRAYTYSAIPFIAYVLTVAAPLTLWLGEVRIVRNRQPALAVIVRLVMVALPLGLAGYLAQRAVDTSVY